MAASHVHVSSAQMTLGLEKTVLLWSATPDRRLFRDHDRGGLSDRGSDVGAEVVRWICGLVPTTVRSAQAASSESQAVTCSRRGGSNSDLCWAPRRY